jgi:hypothetical protein
MKSFWGWFEASIIFIGNITLVATYSGEINPIIPFSISFRLVMPRHRGWLFSLRILPALTSFSAMTTQTPCFWPEIALTPVMSTGVLPVKLIFPQSIRSDNN